MLFNSIEFAVFLPVVFLIYWFITNKNLKLQNAFVVVSSYVFYGWWDWRFLILIFMSTLEDYIVALKLNNTDDEKKRKLWLFASIAFNLGILGFFKYCDFFIENFVEAFTFFGLKANISVFNIILPVGISFYTFQTMSYTIDVYQRKIEPTKDFIAFAAFVSFFPLLVAGPIERAKSLLPQFFVKRVFDYSKAADGMRQILWGLFKKIVIADNIAFYVNYAYGNYQDVSGSTLLLATFFFLIQIYCDFSGYSDIAIGTARLFGFNAMRNFNFPFFSRNIAEFWQRWHISLTTWFRDYVYFPLGGNRCSTLKTFRNTVIVYTTVGFWHGADWTFIIFGFIHSLYFIPVILGINKKPLTAIAAEGKLLPSAKEFFQMVFTFSIVLFSAVFFRAQNIVQAAGVYSGMADISLLSISLLSYKKDALVNMIIIVCFMIIEWRGRENQYSLEKFGLSWKKPIRLVFYHFIFIVIIYNFFALYSDAPVDFIYFQF
jgi:D-alanyl-lipoteichoic acid acyltransferase DltB (MBOAT superfamily)